MEDSTVAYFRNLSEGRLTTIHKQRADIANLRIELWRTNDNLQREITSTQNRENALANVIYKDVSLCNLLKIDALVTDWKERTSYVLNSLHKLDNESLTTEQQRTIVHACTKTLQDMKDDDNIARPKLPSDKQDYDQIALENTYLLKTIDTNTIHCSNT